MNEEMNSLRPVSRRSMLQTVSGGFGWLAFSALEARRAAAESANPLAPKAPHFPAKAKRVIFLCMQGGPSHVDTFDHKPKLKADNGKTIEARRAARLLASPWEFKANGQGGLMISELYPELSKHADDLCLLNSMKTDLPAHPQAFVALHTGNPQFVRPSLGSWALYGLGTENENLPGFITLSPPIGLGGAQNYGSSFLPAIYQGSPIGRQRLPITRAQVNNIANRRLNSKAQRVQLDLVQAMNRERLAKDEFNPEIEGVIESYELAFRMQSELPGVMDISGESEATKRLYGVGDRETDDFGRQCLLARRMVEKGVRFVEITHGNWDQHQNLEQALERNCNATDKPIAGLLADLKSRDMLKDTLVIWGGEFGRTPYAQNNNGRDHNNRGYSMWLAGGGVRGGRTYGSTDDYGHEAVDKVMHTHDFHATLLSLLGLDHERLTFNYAGRDFRLTDVYGNVAKEIAG